MPVCKILEMAQNKFWPDVFGVLLNLNIKKLRMHMIVMKKSSISNLKSQRRENEHLCVGGFNGP